MKHSHSRDLNVPAPSFSALRGHARVFGHAVAGAARHIAAAGMRRYRMHMAEAELQALDDRTLLDMGVRRDSIKSLVRHNLTHGRRDRRTA